jgi:hypothetical protein
VAVSPDRRTLFVTSNSLSAYDVPADTFQLKQEGSGGDYGFYPDDIEINNAGPFLALPGATGNSNTNYTTSEVSTSDINVFHGSYHTGAYCGSLAFSADDTVLFEDIITGNKVDLFNIATSHCSRVFMCVGTPTTCCWTTAAPNYSFRIPRPLAVPELRYLRRDFQLAVRFQPLVALQMFRLAWKWE